MIEILVLLEENVLWLKVSIYLFGLKKLLIERSLDVDYGSYAIKRNLLNCIVFSGKLYKKLIPSIESGRSMTYLCTMWFEWQ